jgi:predicted AlkP superfamily pyrophosphatase or phosphodiesterase
VHPLVVLNVVGLAHGFIGEHTPNLKRLADRGAMRPLATVLPAVTCTAQSSLLTGGLPRDHGIVANGWYFRDLAEIMFWRQSNHLVTGEYVWDAARRRDPSFTAANMFWWYNMYSSADWGVTPRPMYPADGRKIPDCYAAPAKLRDELTERFGRFPLFTFWGPATDISSSRWIADATLYVRATRQPTLTVCYLPHLDYNLQRLGPDHPAIARDLADIDAICGELIEDAERSGARIIVLSEYGIVPVDRPVHINRALRQAKLIQVREELGRELLDAGASQAFAVADHQIAHVYVRSADRIAEVKALLEGLPGVERRARRGRQARGRPRPSALRRARGHCESGVLVHLLLLARRCPRARFRPHRRDPPQARLRSGRAVHRSGVQMAQGSGRLAVGQAQARISRPARRHPA